jgi:putative ABC transport system permease protein
MIKKDIILTLAARNVRLHFMRSVLAALGIVIGVVAIASIGMVGANMTLSVTEELSDMANKLSVTPYPWWRRYDGRRAWRRGRRGR